MLLDHRQDVASELQAGWRAETHSERVAGGGRTMADPAQHRSGLSHLRQAMGSFMHTHHPHVPAGLHAFSRGH